MFSRLRRRKRTLDRLRTDIDDLTDLVLCFLKNIELQKAAEKMGAPYFWLGSEAESLTFRPE
jgi:predicted DNA-binding protein (UPF0251 family)